MEIKAGRKVKIVYCLTLVGSLASAGLASSGWLGLLFGGGLFRTGLLFPTVLFLLFGYRVFSVIRNPTALDIGANGMPLRIIRAVAVLLMCVGLASMTGLFFVKPITLSIFAHAGDGGVGYFVVEIFLVMLTAVGIVGIALFEFARLLGPRVKTSYKNIKPESGLLRRLITTLGVLAALAFALRAGAENFLWDAVTHNDIGKAKILIILGADVNSKNRFGSSILHQAVSGGNAKLVELLISKGADVNAKGQFGRTPLHFAGK